LGHPGAPQSGDRLLRPADWAWIGGLFTETLPMTATGKVLRRELRALG
jgi:acyl-CoA synthetase (AMP-forming)/AMP-acid ligase II